MRWLLPQSSQTVFLFSWSSFSTKTYHRGCSDYMLMPLFPSNVEIQHLWPCGKPHSTHLAGLDPGCVPSRRGVLSGWAAAFSWC